VKNQQAQAAAIATTTKSITTRATGIIDVAVKNPWQPCYNDATDRPAVLLKSKPQSHRVASTQEDPFNVHKKDPSPPPSSSYTRRPVTSASTVLKRLSKSQPGQ